MLFLLYQDALESNDFQLNRTKT